MLPEELIGTVLAGLKQEAETMVNSSLQEAVITVPATYLLIYDFGGGTFDAALIQKQGDSFKLLCQPLGDKNCGGIDFDRAIFQDLKERYFHGSPV